MERYPGQIREAVELLKRMQRNSREFRMWENAALARRVAGLLEELPDRGEEHTPYDKIFLLNLATENISCSDTPRLAVSLFGRMLTLFDAVRTSDWADYDDPIERQWIEEAHRKWRDYIDIENMDAEEWRRRHACHLRFDPVERTERWEALYERMEAEIDAETDPDVPRGMGFCHYYWSVKRAVLRRHGIDWRSPSAMNPGVLFD